MRRRKNMKSKAGPLEGRSGPATPHVQKQRATVVAMALTCIALMLGTLLLLGQRNAGVTAEDPQQSSTFCPAVLGYRVVQEFNHDPNAFTQGLEYDSQCDNRGNCTDIFWESTGLYGQSTVRKVEVATGKVLQRLSLGSRWFAEGVTRLGDHLYQLTWQTGTIFKWLIKPDYTLVAAGSSQGPLNDGWGLASDGSSLLATDSSAFIYFINPSTMKETKRIQVTDGGVPIKWLNEIEVIEGELWGNIWQTECLARINMTTGMVTHWVMMHGLMQGLRSRFPTNAGMDVLNGIAYDKDKKRLFVTGKKWPKIFEVSLQPLVGAASASTIDQVRRKCVMMV
ncbi:glutamine cyclotransferase-domain-containing protein [Haematococcus lacustris]